MRTKIKVNNKFYRPVPWLVDESCDGCHLDEIGRSCPFNTEENNTPCDDGNEFSGMIFIATNKQALASYIATKLGADDEVQVDG